MAKRPFVDFREVKERVPLPEVLDVLGLLEHLEQKSSTKIQGVCPMPSHVHGPMPNADQFKVDLKNGIWLWHCFGDCDCGGDVVEFVKNYFDYTDAHARLWFADKFGDRLTLTKPRSAKKTAKSAPKGGKAKADSGHEETPPEEKSQVEVQKSPSVAEADKPLEELRFYLNLDPKAAYLEQRGVAKATIDRFKLGLCQKGLLKGYVAMPIYWHDGESWLRVAYMGRWPSETYADEDQERYKLPVGFPKNRVLYGLRQALEDAGEAPALIVVEGPFSVFHLRQAGFANTVATLGSSLSDEQTELLIATGKPIVLLFDGDEAGYAGMRQAAGKLIQRTFVRAIKLPAGQQPDHLPAEDIQQLLSFLS